MPNSVLSSKGQIVIPKPLRDAMHWTAGAELSVEPKGDAVVVRLAEKPWRLPTREELDRVAGCLKYDGPSLSIEEMDRRAREAIARKWRK